MTKKTITSFERKEIKYLLTLEQKNHLFTLIGNYLQPDEHGESGNYKLMSLYYDSPEKDFYREKRMKFANRKKIRIRRYVGTSPAIQDSDQVFIEIKEHTEVINYKRRVSLRADEAFALLEEGKRPIHNDPKDQAVIEEILALRAQYHLEPSAVTSYQRQAYKTKKSDGGIRITFDQGVTYRTEHLNLDRQEGDNALIDEHMEIMEIKVKGELPVWTQAALQICGIEASHFSKYTAAIEKGLQGRLIPPAGVELDLSAFKVNQASLFQVAFA